MNQTKPQATDFDKVRHMVRQSLISSGVRLKTAHPMAHKITMDLIAKGLISENILDNIKEEELDISKPKEEEDD